MANIKSLNLLRMPKRRTILFTLQSRILTMRGQRVILDNDLAELYGVAVRRLNQQVKRNPHRFPPDFVFQLTAKERNGLRSQIVISNGRRGGRRYLPYAFTEHGAIMAATVLNSRQAMEMSVFVVRAFVQLRMMLATNRQLAVKIAELEDHLETHDSAIQELIEAIKELSAPEKVSRRKIGFQVPLASVRGVCLQSAILSRTAQSKFQCAKPSST
jgi:ORF6N domain